MTDEEIGMEASFAADLARAGLQLSPESRAAMLLSYRAVRRWGQILSDAAPAPAIAPASYRLLPFAPFLRNSE